MDLREIRNSYISEGYGLQDASNKTCQDIILSKIIKGCTVFFKAKRIWIGRVRRKVIGWKFQSAM